MLGRIVAATATFLLLITKLQQYTVAVGEGLLHLSGFWAFYIPALLVALAVFRLLDMENWGVPDAAALAWLGVFALYSLTGDATTVALELVKSTTGFAMGLLFGALIAARSVASRG